MGHARVILCYDIFLVICTFTVIVANSLGEHWQTTLDGNLKEIVPFALSLAFSSKQTLCCHIFPSRPLLRLFRKWYPNSIRGRTCHFPFNWCMPPERLSLYPLHVNNLLHWLFFFVLTRYSRLTVEAAHRAHISYFIYYLSFVKHS